MAKYLKDRKNVWRECKNSLFILVSTLYTNTTYILYRIMEWISTHPSESQVILEFIDNIWELLRIPSLVSNLYSIILIIIIQMIYYFISITINKDP